MTFVFIMFTIVTGTMEGQETIFTIEKLEKGR
jgi:hypothetical protein